MHTSKAQELVLSQPYTAAQFLSPASVGNGVFDQRIQSNLRSQSIGGSNFARTIVIGWDRKYNRRSLDQTNYLGIGGQIISEQLMNGLLNTNYITFNTAYHLFLDGDDYSNLAIGLGITYAQLNLDRSKLRFGDMYDALSGDFSIGTNEIFLTNPGRMSANTGLLYTRHSTDTYFQLSANGFFFAKPDVTNSPYNEAPGMRSTLFLNVEKYFSEDYTYLFHGAFSSRNKENTYVAGASISLPILWKFDHDRRLYVGCYYRVKDAIIPSVNIMMDDYIFGMSYDIYNNGLSAAGIRSNSFELTFSKSFGKRKQELMRTLFD
ncbi:MAG: type IX secretion system membrane protein PorP/SprF [Sediminibacterium sp.]